LGPLAWAIAVIAFVASSSGWFSVVGLPIAVVAVGTALAARSRGALIVAVASIGIASVWLLVDLLVG